MAGGAAATGRAEAGVAAGAVEDGTFASLVADDGFHLSTEGHARIAEVFAAAL